MTAKAPPPPTEAGKASGQIPGAASTDRFFPLRTRDVRFEGEIDRRIRAAITENLSRLDWNRDFLESYRRKNWPGGVDESRKNTGLYIGIGKNLSALVRFEAYTGDPTASDLKALLIRELTTLQDKDGYLGTFVPDQRIQHAWDLHDMIYIVLGLVDNFNSTGDKASLSVARTIADYVMKNCPPDKLPGCKLGTERAFIALSRASGDRRTFDYAVTGTGLRQWRPKIEGHAYTFMNMCLAQLDVYSTERDPALLEMSRQVMQRLEQGSLLIHGTCSVGEGFNADQSGFGSVGETCVTAYLMRLSGRMLQIEGNPLYGDIIERSLYNALFAAQSPDGRRLRYFIPYEGPRHYFYLDGYCCPGNWRRIVSELPEMAYYRSVRGVAINLYAPSSAHLTLENGIDVAVRQDTDYPSSGRILVRIQPSKPSRFALELRVPRWSRNPAATVNGKAVNVSTGEWLTIDREWKDEDVVELDLGMEPRLVRGRGGQDGRAAVMRGPVLFCLNPALQAGDNPLFRGFGPRTGDRLRAGLALAQVQALDAAAKREPIRIAELVTGGPEFGLDPRTGRASVRVATRLSVEPGRFVPAENPFVNGVFVPDAGPGGRCSVPLSTTGLEARDVPRTTGITWDFIRSRPAMAQASATVGGVDYSADPHSMLAMHGNKGITLDLEWLRKLTGVPGRSVSAKTGGQLAAFRAVACFGGPATIEPRSAVSVYVDGRPALPRTRVGREPLPISIPLQDADRFLTIMFTDTPMDFSYGQLAADAPLEYAETFLGDPVIAVARPSVLAAARKTLCADEPELRTKRDASADDACDRRPEYDFMRDLTLDPSSIGDPVPDAAIRPGGQILRARAWSPGRARTEPPDLTLELTEFTDPESAATFLRVPDGSACVDDELLTVPDGKTALVK